MQMVGHYNMIENAEERKIDRQVKDLGVDDFAGEQERRSGRSVAVVREFGICGACGHASRDGAGSIGAALAPIVADYSGEGRRRRMFADGNHVSAGAPVIMESGAPAIMRLMRLEISRRHIAHDDSCRK